MNNYEISLQAAMKRFCSYDKGLLSQRSGVVDLGDRLQTRFLGMDTQIHKATGQVTVEGQNADFCEALSVFDWLCDRKPDAVASNAFCPVSSLSGVYVSGSGLKMQSPRLATLIQQKPERFSEILCDLGGQVAEIGDLGFRMEVFPGLSMQLKFYFADEEFPPTVVLLWDKNMLHFVRYETIYYIAGTLQKHLTRRLTE